MVSFGQPSGPPASAKQVRELLELLEEAGHRDFRDARGPMGFTQRQAGGKFSRDEADAFIERLQEAAAEEDAPRPLRRRPRSRPSARPRPNERCTASPTSCSRPSCSGAAGSSSRPEHHGPSITA
jgi:hypothetical protein